MVSSYNPIAGEVESGKSLRIIDIIHLSYFFNFQDNKILFLTMLGILSAGSTLTLPSTCTCVAYKDTQTNILHTDHILL